MVLPENHGYLTETTRARCGISSYELLVKEFPEKSTKAILILLDSLAEESGKTLLFGTPWALDNIL